MRSRWLLLAFVLLVPGSAAAQRLRIVVGGPNFRPFPIAAPAITSAVDGKDVPRLTTALTDALRLAIDLARPLELVPPGTYLSPEKEPFAQPQFQNWVNVGASGLVRAQIDSVGSTVKVSFRFFDVVSQRELLARTYEQPHDQAVRTVHQFVDLVIETLTGEPGIFSSRVAYVKRMPHGKSIYTSNVDGSDPKRVSDEEVLSLLPTWDPSGRFLLFTSYLKGNPDLFRFDRSNNGLEWLSKQRGLNTGANVSPDGKHIALTLSMDGNTEIYVMDWNGENLRRLTDSWGQDISPCWSPDGRRIVFVSSRAGNPHLYIMDADGANVRRLTYQGNYNQEPRWSPRPDGQIAFTARDERLKFDIFAVQPENGEITRLTQDEGDNESPSYSPDGHNIVFVSTRPPGANHKLYIMDADGNNQRRITFENGEYESPAWGPRLGYK
jgi:TolB protein